MSLSKIFVPSLKGSRRGASLLVPQKRCPYGNRHQFPEPYLTYLSGSPVKEPPKTPLQVPSQNSLIERERDAVLLEPPGQSHEKRKSFFFSLHTLAFHTAYIFPCL